MSTVQSVERALALLREIGREPGGLVDLAGRVGLPTSTAARLLATLEAGDAVRRDDGVYAVGPMMAALSPLAAPPDAGAQVQALAHPHLVDLSELLDEAACFSVISGREIVTVDQVDAPKPVQAENWTGTRVPLHAGGAGLVAMATWPDEEIDDYLRGDLVRCSEHTVTDPGRLAARIRKVRGTRVMWTHGEYVEGLSSCSAAVVGADGRALGALYSYGPSYRYPGKGDGARVAELVRARADAVSEQLGYHPGAG